jgi:hypothetical protein
MRLRTLAAGVAAALLAALPLVAQEQRGSVEGVVKGRPGRRRRRRDRHGEAPERSVVVGRHGRDRQLPLRHSCPGHYEITAALSGFAPSKVSNIDLRLGQVLSVNMTLSRAA